MTDQHAATPDEIVPDEPSAGGVRRARAVIGRAVRSTLPTGRTRATCSRGRPGRAGGHRRPARGLPAGARRARRAGRGHGLLATSWPRPPASTRRSCARTCPISARTASAASATTSPLLVEQIERTLGLTRRARGRAGRRRQPRPRAGRLRRVRLPRLPRRRAVRRRPRPGRRADRRDRRPARRRAARRWSREHGHHDRRSSPPRRRPPRTVCDRLVDGGVTSILNFAPVVLPVPDEVDVRKVDLAVELQILAFHEQRKPTIGGSALRGRWRARVARAARPVGRARRTVQCGMSVLVVGLSHRSAPVALLERAAVARRRRCRSCSTSCCAATTSARCCCCPPATGSRSTPTSTAFHGGLPDVSTVLARHAGLDVAELTEHLYVHYDGRGRAAPVRGGRRAGLDGRRRGADPRPAARRLRARRPRSARSAAALHELCPAGAAGRQAGARRDRDRPAPARRSSPIGARPTPPSAVARPPRRAAGAGRRRRLDGRAGRGHAAPRPGSPSSWWPTGPRSGPRRLAAQLGGAGTRGPAAALTALGGELAARRPACVACTGAIGTVRDRDAVVDAALPARGRPPAGRAATSRCRATSTRRGRAARRHYLSTSAALQEPAVRLGAHAGRGARPGELVAEEVAGHLAAQRAAEVTPTVTALRGRAAEVVDAELLRLDARLPGPGRGRRASEVARTVRRVVDKLLHAPTVRVKQLAERPDGDALRRRAARAVRPRPGRPPPRSPAAPATCRSAGGPVVTAEE